MLKTREQSIEGKTVTVSGREMWLSMPLKRSINWGESVQYPTRMERSMIGLVSPVKVGLLDDLKNVKRGRIKEFAQNFIVNISKVVAPGPSNVILPALRLRE